MKIHQIEISLEYGKLNIPLDPPAKCEAEALHRAIQIAIEECEMAKVSQAYGEFDL